ncbi:acetate/propionate family kinase [Paracoccus aerodenitrificans]|uniref:acetate/propionate family kinase n=1 Tax=Paracoccus aerodenitrificans TaxID=3017781 RepID=UPI0022F06BE1|nr:acetate/propionate family kinase [Paracoccus aerodenitrificans]WBU63975.1 acetate/propionate family kinase [Paracoccus aerodenitrificans]
MTHAALILNAGSSSLKFAVYVDADETPEASGQVDRIGPGPDHAEITLADASGTALPVNAPGSLEDHQQALNAALSGLRDNFPDIQIGAVGHRVVHGGPDFTAPTLIDDEVLGRLTELEPLAPLHQPHCLSGIRAAQAAFPDAQQVACFDTSFHRSMPRLNEIYAIPREYYDDGIRRYGFHGISYDYISGALRQTDPQLSSGRVVVAHLGNGASLCALRNGKSVATTMGFSALDGLAMGTRSGQIDPGVLLYLLDQGMAPADLSNMLYRKSGLLGLSGLSNDMRTLENSDLPEAAEAVSYFIQRLQRGIAEMAAAMEGLDGIVFTAGIGEHSASIRAETCRGLAWMGVTLDDAANQKGAAVISAPESRIAVRVMATREDLVILRAVRKLAA